MSYLGRGSNLTRKAQDKVSFLATAGQTVRTGLSYVPTHVDVTVNGITLTEITDYTATNGNSITFTVALALNDEVTIVSSKTFDVANHYTISAANALLAAKLPKAGGTMTGALNVQHAAAAVAKFQSTATNGGYVTYVGGSTTYIGAPLSFLGTGTASDFGIIGTGANNFVLGTSSAEKMRIDSSGHAIIPAGVTLGTAAGVYSAANTLDDYEEGTWTPVAGSGITITSGTATFIGGYTKIGNKVFFTLTASGTFTAAFSANANFSGLPFAVSTIDTGLIHDASGGEKSITEIYSNEIIYILDALGSSISQNLTGSGSYTTT